MENGEISRDLLLFSINKRITITVQTLEILSIQFQ